MKIAICDDLHNDVQILKDLIKKYCLDNNLQIKISTYISGKKLISDFKVNEFTIIFLDIYLNDENEMTGIQVAKEIRKKDKNCIIIFVTTSKEHALEAFEVDATQYLVKPITYDKIKHLFDKFQKYFLESMRFIEIVNNKIVIKIFLKDIYYIEVYDKLCLIHLSDKIVKTYTSLSKLFELLGGIPFLKCHRSYVINMSYIKNIVDNNFILKNNNKIPISKDKSSEIKQIYYDYFFAQIRGENNV